MQLQPATPPSRLLALLRQHEKLLATAANKRRDLDRAKERARRVQGTMTTRVAPLTVELFEVERDLHAVFAVLLAKGRLSKAARRTAQDVYRHLIREGVISDGQALDPEELAQFKAAVAGKAGPSRGGPGPDVPPPWARTEDAASAQRPTGAGAETIRAVYRRLANAIHPDKVQSEEERERRTEAMKVVTRAYMEGDLARLLEVERGWLGGGPSAGVAEGEDAVEEKCASLERTNASLDAQVKALKKELRELCAFPPHREVQGFATASPSVFEQRLEALVAGSAEAVKELKTIRDFVASFRDGKISVEEFGKGPPGVGGSDVEDLLAAEVELRMILEGLEAVMGVPGERTAGAGGRRGKAKGKRRG